MDRRSFLTTSAAALGAASSVFGSSPNENLRVAIIGMGGRGKGMGRGKDHINGWSKVPNSEIAAICDIDDAQIAKGLDLMQSKSLPKPKVFKDIRKLLEDKNIDAI